MHIQDILRGIGKEVTPENRASLGGSLAAYVRRGEIFSRPAPNTFALLSATASEEEPPPEFGHTKPKTEEGDEIPF